MKEKKMTTCGIENCKEHKNELLTLESIPIYERSILSIFYKPKIIGTHYIYYNKDGSVKRKKTEFY